MNGGSLGPEVGLLEVGRDMKIPVNQETVNDIAKLMMHRLISREIGRDPSLNAQGYRMREPPGAMRDVRSCGSGTIS
jgi:hypothetical protein